MWNVVLGLAGIVTGGYVAYSGWNKEDGQLILGGVVILLAGAAVFVLVD